MSVADDEKVHTKADEIQSFLFISIVLFPVLTIAFIGLFGLIIWISQLLFGPPTA